METVYKALMEENGELRSTIAGRGLGVAQDKPKLTYKEGEITYAPEGTKGIYVWESLGEARKHVRYYCEERGRVHEATPLGKKGHDPIRDSTTYPAILLGKEVWLELAPKEEWVDVTGECAVKLEGNHVEVWHKNVYVLALGGKYSALTIDSQYKVEVNLLEGCCGKFKVFHKKVS